MAELADVQDHRGNNSRHAVVLYESAIHMANQLHLVHDQAIALQLLGEFHLRRNRRENDSIEQARACLGRSVILLETWGANAKAQHLRNKHSDILQQQ